MTMGLNLDELKKLAPWKKGLIVFVVCLLVGYLDYMYFLQGIIDSQISLREKLSDMEPQIVAREKVASQIGKYRRDVENLNATFSRALLKLPNQREIASLLNSIVLSGRQTGVNFLLFEPVAAPRPVPDAKAAAPVKADKKGEKTSPEEPRKFYDEILVSVKLSGTFHNIISFFGKVAELSRIVNIENVAIADAKPINGGKMIVVASFTMKTYKFVDRERK